MWAETEVGEGESGAAPAEGEEEVGGVPRVEVKDCSGLVEAPLVGVPLEEVERTVANLEEEGVDCVRIEGSASRPPHCANQSGSSAERAETHLLLMNRSVRSVGAILSSRQVSAPDLLLVNQRRFVDRGLVLLLDSSPLLRAHSKSASCAKEERKQLQRTSSAKELDSRSKVTTTDWTRNLSRHLAPGAGSSFIGWRRTACWVIGGRGEERARGKKERGPGEIRMGQHPDDERCVSSGLKGFGGSRVEERQSATCGRLPPPALPPPCHPTAGIGRSHQQDALLRLPSSCRTKEPTLHLDRLSRFDPARVWPDAVLFRCGRLDLVDDRLRVVVGDAESALH